MDDNTTTPAPTVAATASGRLQTSTNFSNPPICASQPHVLQYNATAAPWPEQDPRFRASLATAVVLLVTGFLSVAVFLVFKSRFDRMRVRAHVVPLMAMLGLLFFIIGSFIQSLVGAIHAPCWVRSVFAISIVPTVGVSASLRYVYFIFLHRLSVSVAAFGARMVGNGSSSENNNNNINNDEDDDNTTKETKGVPTGLAWYVAAFAYTLKLVLARQPTPNEVEDMKRTMTRRDQVMLLQILKFILSPMGQACTAITFVFPFAIINVVYEVVAEPSYYAGCVACYVPARSQQSLIIFQIAFFVVMLSYLGYQTRGLKDHFGFFEEGRRTTVCILAGGIVYISYSFRPWPTPAWFDPAIVVAVFIYLMLWQATIVPVIGAFVAERQRRGRMSPLQAAKMPRKAKQVKKQHSNGNASGAPSSAHDASSTHHAGHQVTLAMILADAKLRAAFAKRVEDEFCPELLTFTDVVSEWELGFMDIAPTARLVRAKRIAQAFIGQGALQEINVSDRVVLRIREKLTEAAVDPARLAHGLFEEAKKEVVQMLEQGPLSRFVETAEYAELVSQSSAVLSAVAVSPGWGGGVVSGSNAQVPSSRVGGGEAVGSSALAVSAMDVDEEGAAAVSVVSNLGALSSASKSTRTVPVSSSSARGARAASSQVDVAADVGTHPSS